MFAPVLLQEPPGKPQKGKPIAVRKRKQKRRRRRKEEEEKRKRAERGRRGEEEERRRRREEERKRTIRLSAVRPSVRLAAEKTLCYRIRVFNRANYNTNLTTVT